MPTPVILFVLGKGGTGKSTSASLMARVLSEQGKKVTLFSLDDAHNLSDIFERRIGHRPVSVSPCLSVIQVDRDREIRQYLGRTAAQVRQSFSYLTAFNLDHYFDVLKFSPGMEEYALVTAFARLADTHDTEDYLIADMPPTALSLRFFNLPALSLAWVSRLEALRMEIRKKKEVISTIRFGKKEIERDKVLGKIRSIRAEHEKILSLFQDSDRSRPVTVTNPDRLAGAETSRIHDQLKTMDIPVRGMILNRRAPQGSIDSYSADLPVLDLPFSAAPLIGLEALDRYIRNNNLDFSTLLS